MLRLGSSLNSNTSLNLEGIACRKNEYFIMMNIFGMDGIILNM